MAVGWTRRDRLCRATTVILQKRAKHGGCVGVQCCHAAAKAVATSLLGLRCAHGSDGDTPSTWEVEGELRHVGLAP